MPPLAILYVGSYLERAGVSVSYIDLRIHSYDDLGKELEDVPLIVGVSSMTGIQIEGAIKVLEMSKEKAPEAVRVMGGVHPSLLPLETLSDPLVDFVVIGEGENTLLELFEFIAEGKTDFTKILGLAWKKRGGQISINANRPFMELADSCPPITEASRALYAYYPLGKVQVSRGCPYRCAFCYNLSFNRRKYRIKPLEVIDREIHTIMKFVPRIKHFTLLSDNVGRDVDRLLEMGKICSKYGFTFHTAIRPEYINERLISELEGVCGSFLIGVESVVPRIRRMIYKDNDVEDTRRAAHLLKNSSIKMYYSFMTAFPDESREETIASMDFADELREIDPTSIITPFFLLTPFPGTELYEYALRRGFKKSANLKDWSQFALGKVSTPWIDPDNEYFTDLYQMSMLIYTDPKEYENNDFEKDFFGHFQRIAWDRWRARTFEFRREYELFKSYNRKFKQAGLINYEEEMQKAYSKSQTNNVD
ncbi:MAG: radical SAM protein [Candidatus Omnitrophota bacterium]